MEEEVQTRVKKQKRKLGAEKLLTRIIAIVVIFGMLASVAGATIYYLSRSL